MCTPQGVLFSRQAILENLLAQKKANKRRLAAWEAQQETLAREVGWLQLQCISTSDQDVWQHRQEYQLPKHVAHVLLKVQSTAGEWQRIQVREPRS